MGGGKKCEPVPNPLGAFQAEGQSDKIDQLIQVIKKAVRVKLEYYYTDRFL